MKSMFLLFALAANTTFAQPRPFSSDSDTAFWFEWKKHLTAELGLQSIEQSDKAFEFRFWGGRKVIRLWEEKGMLQGKVIYFLREHQEDAPEHRGRIYQSWMVLDEPTLQTIRHFISDFNILELPTDNQIDGWGQGFDGTTYFIETSQPEHCSFKNYWSPWSFPNLKEARFFRYFIQQLNSITVIEKGLEQFMKNQPFHSYHVGLTSATIAIKPKEFRY